MSIIRQWRIATTHRTIYMNAVDSKRVRAIIERNGLMTGERVLSTTAIGNAGIDGGFVPRTASA